MRGLALATGIVLALSAPLAWLIERSILPALDAAYLSPLVLTLVVVVFAQLAIVALRRFVPEAGPIVVPAKAGTQVPDLSAHGTWIPAFAGMTAVSLIPLVAAAMAMFALVSLDVAGRATLAEATGLGLVAALVVPMLLVAFAAMLDRVRAADVPPALRGAPIALVTAGLMALALMGLAGLGAR